ncbi:hypothetical protein ASPZODRAFT_137448 [Penicilliopsis zonata CBS 506.65]|uniref:Uncharacterized protein n=1 Tax=Penicilliopsis zonata CBS 506.65 TaxID=1073090 RepID=A0A1L9S4W0_9EURO|nr:hypothetical protein ASPZODRAFT_137448 [Penicilliopsis zonata CBS 506.65]OJJ42181.1 hypothetical protein ASPZODRAFT_137448 [Penicilliopsis zonata CBS 506.65]
MTTCRFVPDEDPDKDRIYDCLTEAAPKIGNTPWSVRGFFGEHNGELITSLGVVWGRG